MRIRMIINLFSVVLMTFLACGNQQMTDIIFINGKIFTARDTHQFVEALAISEGVIVAAGKNEDALAYNEKIKKLVDLQGKTVVPGFHDAHLHFWSGAQLAVQENLTGIRSKSEILRKIDEAAHRKKPGEWITGRGWDHELWDSKELPNHQDLDEVAPQNYVYLKRVDGHAAWVNRKVLNLLNYNSQTADPPGGKIVKDPQTGEPTGILIDTAFDSLDNLLSMPSTSQRTRIIYQAIQYANSLGITSMTDNSPAAIYENYADLFAENKLTMRVNFWVYGHQNLDSLRNEFSRFQVNRQYLQASLAKFFADGSMGSSSALLFEPYLDDPGNLGLPQKSREELLSAFKTAQKSGWQIGVHAIGDAGNAMTLDLFEVLLQDDPQTDPRLRIEHAQFVQPRDILRFQELNVIASMQASHCISDMKWVENRIGDRARYTYSWRSMLDSQVPLAFGTDWPVEPLNPMLGIYAAVTRQDTLGNPSGSWYPEQCLTVGEAVYAYTAGAAYAVKAENWLGRLLPGYAADLVILDRDIFSIPAAEILETRVLDTYLGGKEVYHSDNR